MFPESKDGVRRVDIQRWELALNGQAVRILHSINDGEYGGESLLVWDRDRRSLVFHYFIRPLPDGRLHVKTQHLKGGRWVDGRDMQLRRGSEGRGPVQVALRTAKSRASMRRVTPPIGFFPAKHCSQMGYTR